LTDLDLSGTKITHVAALRGLENLTGLDLSYTDVTDGTALRGLKKLQVVRRD
jgi:Leucine-rich repeat (LRR) protein